MTSLPPWRLRSYPLLLSTQDFCRGLAQAGEPGRLAIRADVQSAGRGTKGRGWESGRGNLFLSALLRPNCPAREATQFALLAGVALAETTAALLPEPGLLRLKWPNDLLLGGGKLAGILTESAAAADGRLDWLVIGFGVNLATAPDLVDTPTACLTGQMGPPAPSSFAASLLERLDHWLERHAAEGFAPVRAEWLRYAPEPGSVLTVRLPGGSYNGVFAGLGDDGRLLLQSGRDVRAFAVGET